MLGQEILSLLGLALGALLLLRLDFRIRLITLGRYGLDPFLTAINNGPQALVRAFRDRTRYKSLSDSTAGVVFLGTPFRGTLTASIT